MSNKNTLSEVELSEHKSDKSVQTKNHRKKMGNWILEANSTTHFFECINHAPDMAQARLVCRFFAAIGKTPQQKLRLMLAEQKIIQEIEANYPRQIVRALGGARFIARLPLLNISPTSGWTPDNIDYIEPHHLGNHSIVRGKDGEGRHFVSFYILNVTLSFRYVMTIFQCNEGRSKWDVAHSQNDYITVVSCMAIFKAPQNITHLLTTLNNTPISVIFGPVHDDVYFPPHDRIEISQHRLQLIRPYQPTAEKIQRDFPDFIVQALGLDCMLQLPILQLGDRRSPDGKINFINSFMQRHGIQFGWDIDNKPVICFAFHMTLENGGYDITLSFYKTNTGNFEYSAVYFSQAPISFSPIQNEIECNLGADLVNPNISSKDKSTILSNLLSQPPILSLRYNERRLIGKGQNIEFALGISQLKCTAIIDPSPYEIYQQYLLDQQKPDDEPALELSSRR